MSRSATTQTTEHGVLTIVALEPPAEPTDAAQAWLVDAVADLLSTMRQRVLGAPQPPQRIALALHAPRGRDAEERALAAGLAAALRGTAQSLARELAPATAVNAVLCDVPEDAETTLELLADPDGGYVTGTTIDLRGGP